MLFIRGGVPSVTDCYPKKNRICAGIVWKRSIRFMVRGAKSAGNQWKTRQNSAETAAELGTASTAALRRTATMENWKHL